LPNREYLDDIRNGVPVDLAPPIYERAFGAHPWPTEALPEGTWAASFMFTDEFNSHLDVAAASAHWEWLSEPRLIY
jgi:hypothetical protein